MVGKSTNVITASLSSNLPPMITISGSWWLCIFLMCNFSVSFFLFFSPLSCSLLIILKYYLVFIQEVALNEPGKGPFKTWLELINGTWRKHPSCLLQRPERPPRPRLVLAQPSVAVGPLWWQGRTRAPVLAKHRHVRGARWLFLGPLKSKGFTVSGKPFGAWRRDPIYVPFLRWPWTWCPHHTDCVVIRC